MNESLYILRASGNCAVVVPREDGFLRIFRKPQDSWQDRYVIGCAIVGTFCCAEVLDRVGFGRKEKVPEISAEIHSVMTIPLFAGAVRNLQTFFSPDPRCISVALVSPIANEGGMGLLDQFQRMQMPFLRLIRRKEGPDRPGTTYLERWGYVLNAATKEGFFSELQEFVNPDKFNAPDEVWAELQAIGRDEQDKIGSNALRVLALGVAIQGHHQAVRASLSPYRLPPEDADYRTDKPDKPKSSQGYQWGGVHMPYKPDKNEGTPVESGWYTKLGG